MGEPRGVDVNVLIGVIERNQQALGQLATRTDALKSEIMGQHDLSRVDHQHILELINRTNMRVQEVMDDYQTMIDEIRDVLISHCSKSESSGSALMDAVKSLQRRDEWIKNFMIIFSSIVGLIVTVLGGFVYNMTSNIKALTELLSHIKK